MKQSRLDELMVKASSNEINMSELAEICGETLKSTSRHSNDIKNKLSDIEKKLAQIFSELNDIKNNQPSFGIIDDMEDD